MTKLDDVFKPSVDFVNEDINVSESLRYRASHHSPKTANSKQKTKNEKLVASDNLAASLKKSKINRTLSFSELGIK